MFYFVCLIIFQYFCCYFTISIRRPMVVFSGPRVLGRPRDLKRESDPVRPIRSLTDVSLGRPSDVFFLSMDVGFCFNVLIKSLKLILTNLHQLTLFAYIHYIFFSYFTSSKCVWCFKCIRYYNMLYVWLVSAYSLDWNIMLSQCGVMWLWQILFWGLE